MHILDIYLASKNYSYAFEYEGQGCKVKKDTWCEGKAAKNEYWWKNQCLGNYTLIGSGG